MTNPYSKSLVFTVEIRFRSFSICHGKGEYTMKLQKITEQNIYHLMELKLKPEQEKFVRSPMYSLAESYYYREDDSVLLFALEKEDQVVGFLSLITEIETKTVYIWRMVIGDRFQGQGLGKESLKVIEDFVYQLKEYEKIVSDYVVGNDTMKKLLESQGYIETGRQEQWNEIIMTKLLTRE